MPCFPVGDTESCVCQRFRMDSYGSCQDRRAKIVELVRGTVAPAFQKYQIRLLLEGLRRQVCNAVNTLPEAAEICRQAAHPYVGVMAGLYHMICNGESSDELAVYGNEIEHVHIAERDRLLPFAGVSAELAALTKQLADGVYEGISVSRPVPRLRYRQCGQPGKTSAGFLRPESGTKEA